MNEKKIAQEIMTLAKEMVAGDEWMDEKTYAFAKEVAKVMSHDRDIEVKRVNRNRIDFIHSPSILVSVPLVLTMMEFGYLGAGDGSDEDGGEPSYESVNGDIFSEKVSGFRIPAGTTRRRDPAEFWKSSKDMLEDIMDRAGA